MEIGFHDIEFTRNNREQRIKVAKVVKKLINDLVGTSRTEFINMIKVYCPVDTLIDPDDRSIKKLDAKLIKEICDSQKITYLQLIGDEPIDRYVKPTDQEKKDAEACGLDMNMYMREFARKIRLENEAFDSETFKKMFKNRFETLLATYNMNQLNLAEAVGCKKSTISKIKNIKVSSVDHELFKKICAVLQCSESYLLLEVNDPKLKRCPFKDKGKIEYGTQIFDYEYFNTRFLFIDFIGRKMQELCISKEELQRTLAINDEEYKKYFSPDFGRVIIPKEHIEKIASLFKMSIADMEKACHYPFLCENPDRTLKPVFNRTISSMNSWLFFEECRGHLSAEVIEYIKKLVILLNSDGENKSAVKTLLDNSK